MSPELQDLARRAMALPGAPIKPDGLSWRSITTDDGEGGRVWDLANTSPAGGGLGGVLLRALGTSWEDIERLADGGVSIVYWEPRPGAFLAEVHGTTLAEGACRVALERGCWPGGVE